MAPAKADSQHRSANSSALGLRFLLLASLSVVLLVVDHRNNHLDVVRKAIGAAVYPLRVVVDAPVSLWRWADETTASRNDLQLENSRLNAERLLTQARLQRYAALEAENSRLRDMLEAASRVRDRVRIAEIMSVSSDPYRHVLVVDKGSNDGVFDGQAMIDANGVVGQIIEAGVLSSQGLLISDPGHALHVAVNRNGLRTIARGTGTFGRLDLPALPNNADIQAGDLLVTTGLGGVFPPGYPVAVVDSVVRLPQESYAAVSAVPAAALDQVREIMLIWSDEEAAAPEEAAVTKEAETGETGETAEAAEATVTEDTGNE